MIWPKAPNLLLTLVTLFEGSDEFNQRIDDTFLFLLHARWRFLQQYLNEFGRADFSIDKFVETDLENFIKLGLKWEAAQAEFWLVCETLIRPAKLAAKSLQDASNAVRDAAAALTTPDDSNEKLGWEQQAEILKIADRLDQLRAQFEIANVIKRPHGAPPQERTVRRPGSTACPSVFHENPARAANQRQGSFR